MKWLKSISLVCFLLGFLFCLGAYLSLSGKVVYLVPYRHARIEVNGVPIPGEVLAGGAVALVTTRDHGTEHSYLLDFAGDTDFVGNMGSVSDCDAWVAPHLPVLPMTSTYPRCRIFRDTKEQMSLIDKGTAMQFTTRDQSIISIKWR